jgi:hypothetical protein
LRDRLRRIFREQLFVDPDTLKGLFNDVPAPVRTELLLRTVNNKLFEVEHEPQPGHIVKGYIVYCNGYYVFQPFAYVDIHIPLSVRAAKYPVRRDEFDPAKFRIEEAPEVVPAAAGAGAGAGAGADADADAGAAAGVGDVEAIWRSLEGWVNAMTRTRTPVELPEPILAHLARVVGDDAGSRSTLNQMIEAFKWLQYAYVSSTRRLLKDVQERAGMAEGHRAVEGMPTDIPPQYLRPFHLAVLSFAWTHWFTYAQQKQLSMLAIESLEGVLEPITYRMRDGTVVRQFFNPGTGKVEYLCEGRECAPAIVAAAKAADPGRNPINGVVINKETTASTYGFITTHNGDAVFKTSNPPNKDKPVVKGSMCSNVSNMSGKYEIMTALGEVLKEAGDEPLMDLEPTLFVKGGERPVTNAVRACTIMEVVLRYMNLRKVDDMRWFYNATEAAKGGHVGAFRRKV